MIKFKIEIDDCVYEWQSQKENQDTYRLKIWRDGNEFYHDLIYENKITPRLVIDIIEEKQLEIEE
jgi:hypothetical protein